MNEFSESWLSGKLKAIEIANAELREELARLRAENAELRSELTPYENCQCIGWHKHLHGICASCSKPVLSWQDAYQTAVEDLNLLRADAERYRYIRAREASKLYVDLMGNHTTLDEAIDAARKE